MAMARFIPQSKISTRNSKTVSRIRYLDTNTSLRAKADSTIRDYFRSYPSGTDVTLSVLASIGRDGLEALSQREGRTLSTAKQDVGIWVAILLVQIYGPDKVETERTLSAAGKWRNASNPVPNERQDLAWVGNYTKHRINSGGRGGFAEPSRWLEKTIRRAIRREPDFAVYKVWTILLADLPDDLDSGSSMAYAWALAKQAVWTTQRSIDDALESKLSKLRQSPFSDEAKSSAAQAWEMHVEKHSPPGLGRFVAFHRSWHVFERKGDQTRRFLLSLKRINSAPMDEDAKAIAMDLAHNEDMPFEAMPRFSECLHLARPTLFPFLNTQQMFVMGQILGLEDEDAFVSRHDYMNELERMLEVQRKLRLTSPNTLDLVLLAMANLDNREYIEELDSFPF